MGLAIILDKYACKIFKLLKFSDQIDAWNWSLTGVNIEYNETIDETSTMHDFSFDVSYVLSAFNWKTQFNLETV